MFDPTNKKTKTNCVSYEEDSTDDTISTSYAHLLVPYQQAFFDCVVKRC